MCHKNRLLILCIVFISVLFSGCASTAIRGETLTYKSDKRYPAYTGKVKVYWKEHGVPRVNTYSLIATVSGMPFWAGIYDAKNYEPLHKYIIRKAAEVGGNGVIIYCGEIGTVGASTCYGDVIRLK